MSPEQELSLSPESVSRKGAGVQLRESHRFSRLSKPLQGAKTEKQKAIKPVTGDRNSSEYDRTAIKRRGNRYPRVSYFRRPLKTQKKRKARRCESNIAAVFFSSDRPLLFMAQANNTLSV